MNSINKVRCLFEQSGTFKNAFKNLGYDAYDYDIQNKFEQTDYVYDLYEQIELCYDFKPSIFDSFNKDDLIMVFFPCVRFERQIMLGFRGEQHGMETWNEQKKLINCMKLHNELNRNYELVCKLFIICYECGLKMIFENPYSNDHYLTRYWCIKPTIIDYNRKKRGDYYTKPTQYFFINIEPSNNIFFEDLEINAIDLYKPIKNMNHETVKNYGFKDIKTARSMIHSDYADRFIREFII